VVEVGAAGQTQSPTGGRATGRMEEWTALETIHSIHGKITMAQMLMALMAALGAEVGRDTRSVVSLATNSLRDSRILPHRLNMVAMTGIIATIHPKIRATALAERDVAAYRNHGFRRLIMVGTGVAEEAETTAIMVYMELMELKPQTVLLDIKEVIEDQHPMALAEEEEEGGN